MDNKKYLYIHRTQAQGAEGAHIRGMISGFRELGLRVEIFGPPHIDPYINKSSCSENTEDKSLLKLTLSRFVRHAPQVVFELSELLYDISAKSRLSRKRKYAKYDFIYERYSLNSTAGCLYAKKTQTPFILEVNDATVVDRPRATVIKSIARKNEKLIFENASLIVTITNYFKEQIVNEHNISADKIIVLQNAVDLDCFSLKSINRLDRKKLNIPNGKIVIGCLGAFLPWHGLEFLLETMSETARKLDLYFLFIGDGVVRQNVLAIAKQKNIEDRVIMTGFMPHDEAIRYLDLVDICVLPDSNKHCSPMKLFEFLAMGKPVVLPTYAPLLDTLKDGEHALFFDPENKDGLKSALLSLIHSPFERDRLGQSGRNLIKEKHTWTQHAETLIKRLHLR